MGLKASPFISKSVSKFNKKIQLSTLQDCNLAFVSFCTAGIALVRPCLSFINLFKFSSLTCKELNYQNLFIFFKTLRL